MTASRLEKIKTKRADDGHYWNPGISRGCVCLCSDIDYLFTRIEALTARNAKLEAVVSEVPNLLIAADKRRLNEISYEEWRIAYDSVRLALDALSQPNQKELT
jgi:hypothetical protein